MTTLLTPFTRFSCTLARSRALATIACRTLLLVGSLLSATVHATALTAADEKSILSVVQAQLQAFASDDAKKAFSYAAPGVRKAVGSAESFMTMVRRDYPVVYRPASLGFLKPEGQDDEVIQRVQMTDAAGNSWLAIYSLERQKDKQWRITGCAVIENKGRMA